MPDPAEKFANSLLTASSAVLDEELPRLGGTMQSSTIKKAPPVAVVWTARVIQTIVVLFMLFDVFGKFMRPAPVVEAFIRQGMPITLAPLIASILLALTILYSVPRTAALGAVLLTGYFGGACACNLRAGFSPFETAFPIMFAAVMWVPIYMLDERVRALLPVRTS